MTVAVVTGATGGMGQIIAAELARTGAHVVTIARDPARAEALRARIGLEVVVGDLSHRHRSQPVRRHRPVLQPRRRN